MTLANIAMLAAAAQSAPLPPQSTKPPLIIDQGRSDRTQPAVPTTPPPADQAATARALSAVETEGSVAAIKGITFEGVKAPAAIAAAAQPFIGQPAGRATLDKLAKALSDAYAKTDIALYTVVIPSQDLSAGQVRVRIAEGFIEDVVYPTGSTPLVRAYADHLRHERPLTRRGLERYLSLMRDIPGLTVAADLLRGRRPGGVVLSLKVKIDHWDFILGIDNRATRDLGDGQVKAEAHGRSLLRSGDSTDLTLSASPDGKRYRYAGLSHSTPIGANGLSFAISGAYLETRPERSSVTGNAATLGATLAYPLIRGNRRNLTLSLATDGINSDAASFGALISSDRTRAVRAAAGYSEVGKKSVLTAGATVSRGLAILGARSAVGLSDTVFTKVNARFTYDRAFGKKWVARLKLAGQYSADRLAAAEQFAIGGGDFGRAFDAAILTGDRGLGESAEIAFRPKLTKRLEGSELFAFADRADIGINDRLGFGRFNDRLSSAGGGFRMLYSTKAWLELEAAKSLQRPVLVPSNDWRISVSWRLSLGKKK